MRSTSGRLAALEAAYGGPARRRRTLEESAHAIEIGYATLADFRLVLGDEPEVLRGHFIALAPAASACRLAGMRWEDGFHHVGGYPPDEPLPEDLARWLNYYAGHLTAPVPLPGTASRSDAIQRKFMSGDRALGAAAVLFAIGDAEGLALRRSIWERHDDTWRLSQKSLREAELYEMSPKMAQNFCGRGDLIALAIQQGAVEVVDVPTPHGSHPGITYAELARLIQGCHAVGGVLTVPT